MQPDQGTLARIWDMLAAARHVQDFVRDMTFAEYESNVLVQSAVERQIEIMGEAARRIPRCFQIAHPEIAWQGIVGQRHVLAHEYGDIIQVRVWRVATVHVPTLVPQLARPLPSTTERESPASQ